MAANLIDSMTRALPAQADIETAMNALGLTVGGTGSTGAGPPAPDPHRSAANQALHASMFIHLKTAANPKGSMWWKSHVLHDWPRISPGLRMAAHWWSYSKGGAKQMSIYQRAPGEPLPNCMPVPFDRTGSIRNPKAWFESNGLVRQMKSALFGFFRLGSLGVSCLRM